MTQNLTFIARTAELTVLEDTLHEVVERGRPALVLVSGTAGMGKTRLLAEFARRQNGRTICWGRAAAAFTPPYAVWHDLLRTCAGIAPDDTPQVVLAKLHDRLHGVLTEAQIGVIGQYLGFDLSINPGVADLFGSLNFGRLALAYLVKAVAAFSREPALLLLEDLHRADDSSLDMVEHVLREVETGRLLLVGSARPSLFERRPAWRSLGTSIELPPLTKAEAHALAAAILRQEPPAPLRSMIESGAERSPFYVEELLRMLIDRRVIERDGDAWHINPTRLSQRVPKTLRGLLRARLNGLSDEARTLLQRASVFGTRFWDQSLDAFRLQDGPLWNVQSSLEDAEAHDLISAHSVHEYVFTHDLLRDAAYASMLFDLRRTYHRQIAAWLETHGRGSEDAALLAEHYAQAGDFEQAVTHLKRMGDAANRVGSHRGALAAFNRALALLPRTDTAARAELLVRLGISHERLSEFARARRLIHEGLKLARQADSRLVEASALNGLGLIAWRQGKLAQAARLGRAALAAARDDDDAGTASSLLLLGNIAYDQGHMEEAAAYFRQSLELRRRLGDNPGIAACTNNLGNVAKSLGQIDDARRFHRETLRLNELINDQRGVALSYLNLGVVERNAGAFEQAERCLEASLAGFRDIGDRWGMALALLNFGNIAYDLAEWRPAEAYFSQAQTYYERIDSLGGVATCIAKCAQVRAGTGDYDEARRLYHRALASAIALNMTTLQLEIVCGFAGLALYDGSPEVATQWIGMARHHASADDKVMALAHPLLEQLREHLPPDALKALLAQGHALRLADVLAEIQRTNDATDSM